MRWLPFADSHRSRPTAVPWLLFRACAQGTPLSGRWRGRTPGPKTTPGFKPGCLTVGGTFLADTGWRDRRVLHRVRLRDRPRHRRAHRGDRLAVGAEQRPVQREHVDVGRLGGVRRGRRVRRRRAPAVVQPGAPHCGAFVPLDRGVVEHGGFAPLSRQVAASRGFATRPRVPLHHGRRAVRRASPAGIEPAQLGLGGQVPGPPEGDGIHRQGQVACRACRRKPGLAPTDDLPARRHPAASPLWGLNPGPSPYHGDALPLS